MTIDLTVKFLSPYIKKGEDDQFALTLPQEDASLERLGPFLAKQLGEKLSYNLYDSGGRLTAEFLINGKHVSSGSKLADGDRVTVIPYICGG